MSQNLAHTEKLDNKKIQLIDFLSFLMGFAQAVLAYVMSSYFKDALGTDNVGIFYLIAYSIVLVFLLNLHKLVKRFGKTFLLYFFFLFKIIAILFLIMLPVSFLGVSFLIIYIITGVVIWVLMDVILESFSEDEKSGRIRGAHLAVMNAGYILGPLISSQLLDKFGFSGVFFLSMLIHALIFSVALFGIRGTNHKFRKNITLDKFIKKIWKRKNVLRIYYISFVLSFFYALMVIYVPLYLLDLGFNWEQLGIAFTIMLIPFVVVQYPIGILADKKTGEKEFLILALVIMGVSTLIFYLADSNEMLTWTLILLGTRVGAAMIEILRESYFYKRIDGNDVDVIDFFQTAKPVAFILGTALSTIFLIAFSIKSIFLLIAIVCFSALYPAFKLVDNKCKNEVGSKC